MTSLQKIEKIIYQENHKLALNILESKVVNEPDNHLFYFLLAKSYLYLKKYQEAFINFEKAIQINPYGFYKNEIYSLELNKLAISGLVETGRKKVVMDLYDEQAVHSRAIYPVADTMMLNNINPLIKPDYYIVPNWLSPSHPLNENLEKVDYPVISMIVDRLTYAEEHLKANLLYSDVIVAMEDYAVDIYKSFGFENVIYVPGAGSIGFDPQSYPKLNLEKIYDVLFIGNINSPYVYKNRNKILRKLDSLKNKYNILITSTGDFQHYWTLMNQSRIIIDATIDSLALNYRMFQAMGIEALCFVEENHLVRELYNDKEDIVLYNLENLDYLINYYLTNTDEYSLIAKNGYLKTINNYTHYHFMKMVIDKVSNIPDLKRKRIDFSKPSKLLTYKGITWHYQNKPEEALQCFPENGNAEDKNNNFVEKLSIYENNPEKELEQLIDNYFKANKDIFMIQFNYINYLFYMKRNYDFCYQLINSILQNDKDVSTTGLGLYYLVKNEEKILEYFKYKHGQIIFSYGLESTEYKEKYYQMAIEHLYRIKGYIESNNNDFFKSKDSFYECLKLGSENVWDYYEMAKLEKHFGNQEKYELYIKYCRDTLPFENTFLSF